MPANAPWKANIPAIINDLRLSGKSLFVRRDIASMLKVRDRAAQLVMDAAGTVPVNGKTNGVKLDNLVLFLETKFDSKAQREYQRKKKLATALQQTEQERAARQVVILDEASARKEAARPPRRLKDLPDSILLEPGRCVVECADLRELFQNLLKLTWLALYAPEEIEEKLSGKQMELEIKAQ